MMTPTEMLDEVRRVLTGAAPERDRAHRDALVRAYHVGLFVAVDECQKLASTSPTLRTDLLRLATRLRQKAKEMKF